MIAKMICKASFYLVGWAGWGQAGCRRPRPLFPARSPDDNGGIKKQGKQLEKEDGKEDKEEGKEGEEKDEGQVVVVEEEDDWQVLFRRLVQQLCFHHMSHDFLCSVVSACPIANASGVLPYIMCCRHVLRTVPRTLQRGANVGNKDRSMNNLECILTSEFKLADFFRVVTVKEEPYKVCINKYVGLAVGFPVAMCVARAPTLVPILYVHVGMPPWHVFDVEGGMKRCAGFEVTLKLGGQVRATEFLFDGVQPWAWKVFRKPWETVVCPSSPYFGNGVLTIRLTMTPVKKEEESDAEDDGEYDY